MNIYIITAFGVVAAITGLILKNIKPEFSAIITILAVCTIAGILLSKLSVVFEFINQIFDLSEVNEKYLKILIKAAGICYIANLGSSICKECGQEAISKQIEIIAKVTIVTIAIPIFTELLKIVADLSS